MGIHDEHRVYLMVEVLIYVAFALVIFMANTDPHVDIYITRWEPLCEGTAQCLRYPTIEFLFGFKEGSFVGSIILTKAVFIVLQLCYSEWATFFHFFGYTVWNTLTIVMVAEVCGLRDGLQILMSIIYVFAMESLGTIHDYVVYKGLIVGNSKIFYILTTIMISMGVSVAIISLIKETLEAGETLLYPTLMVIAATVYGGANRGAKYYFYYMKIPEEFNNIRRIKNDTSRIPRIKQYVYLVENDPSVIVKGELYIRVIQFVWIVTLAIIHLTISDRTINYIFN